MLHSCLIPTPLGEMLAMASEQGLCLLEFADQHHLAREIRQVEEACGGSPLPGMTTILADTASQLAAYFVGEREDFDLPLDLVGTPFQLTVWQALLQIPYGHTWSYGQEAAFIGRPTASRAVANANGQNKISIVIPCHRVIGSDGSLTGYGGGLARKKALLALEATHDEGARGLF
ncbi:MAG: methylated-DNA--[protein]-cysteine S-methyltransferase [Rhodocyclaceae bacterium]|jgi:methylated-DNA-[protein]-cysteine S-methyltransferase|nr:methylated-DNA--[protein]-cysteine S-methyltransferase [Rhodocyclaceae bacterium]